MKPVTNTVLSAMLVVAALKEASAATTPAPAKTTAPVPRPPEKMGYTVIGMYGDDKCSSLSALTFTTGPTSQCQVLDCTVQTTMSCASDYKSALSAKFGKDPYVTMISYEDNKCSTVSSGSAYPADGVCHAAEKQSVKASVNADKTVTLAMFSDTKCSSKPMMSMVVSSDNNGKCMGGKVTLSAVNITPGKAAPSTYTVSSYFADDKCATQPAMMVAPPNPGDAVACTQNSTCTKRTMTQCAQDPKKVLAQACGNKPCVQAQLFDDDSCSGEPFAIMMLPVDNTCRSVNGESMKAVLNADKTVSIGSYKDDKCSVDFGDVMLVASDNVNSCEENKILSVQNIQLGKAPPAAFTVSKYFADDKCGSQPAMKIVPPAPGKISACSNSTCTERTTTQCTQDPKKVLTQACSNKPCVQAQLFDDDSCSGVPYATMMLPVDNTCRSVDGESMKAVLNADKTVSIGSYKDGKCSVGLGELLSVTSDNVNRCQKNKILSVQNVNLGKGSLPPQPTVGLAGYYTDDKCKNLSAYSVAVGRAGSCKNSTCSGRQTMTCTDDLQKTMNMVYASSPFVQVLQYTEDDCRTLAGGILVPLDGQCHAMENMFFKAVVNGDKTVTGGMYSDTKCTKDPQTSLITSDNAGQCHNGMTVNVVNQKLGKGPVTPLPKPAPALKTNVPVPTTAASSRPTFAIMSTFTDAKCSGAPGIMLVTPATSNQCQVATCVNQMTMACTDDLSKAATITFGTKPFVLAATYADSKCSNFTSGAVVAMDGQCRGVGGMFMKAQQASDMSVSVGYFSDSKCTQSVRPVIKVTKDTLGKCSGNVMMSVGNVSLTK